MKTVVGKERENHRRLYSVSDERFRFVFWREGQKSKRVNVMLSKRLEDREGRECKFS